MPSWNQRERNFFEIGNIYEDVKKELPCFTCCHCGRVVVQHPQRTRPRNVCRKCDSLTCDFPGCVSSCNPIWADVAKPDDGQPYLLRADDTYTGIKGIGEPVDLVWKEDDPDPFLIIRKHNGLTQRQMKKLAKCHHRWWKPEPSHWICMNCDTETRQMPRREVRVLRA